MQVVLSYIWCASQKDSLALHSVAKQLLGLQLPVHCTAPSSLAFACTDASLPGCLFFGCLIPLLIRSPEQLCMLLNHARQLILQAQKCVLEPAAASAVAASRLYHAGAQLCLQIEAWPEILSTMSIGTRPTNRDLK